MDANKMSIKPVRNERGYFIAVSTDGSKVPQVLADQVWLSEKEANISIMVHEEEPAVAAKGI